MASIQRPSRLPVILFLLGCTAMGGYGTLGAGSQNGFFDSITIAAGNGAANAYFPAGPKPYLTHFTGIGPIDDLLVRVVNFFVFAIDGEHSWDLTLPYCYLMMQFAGGMSLVMLEGWRKGNRRSAARWTGIMGLIVQVMSYTVTVPLYLVLHLLVSPVAESGTEGTADVIDMDVADCILLPISNVIAMIIPTILMSLPSPSMIAPQAHYAWIAIWQPFPVVQNAVQWLLKQLTPAGNPKQKKPLGFVYGYILFLCLTSQLGLLAVALTPASAVPASWQPIFTEVTFSSAFLPHWPWASPQVDPSALPNVDAGWANLAKLFFQWDVYCAGAGILAWSLYLHQVSLHKGSLLGILLQVVPWVLAGGPVAGAAIILWARDEKVGGAMKMRKAK